MARATGGRKPGGSKNKKGGGPRRSDREAEEIIQLDAAIAAGAPPPGTSAVSAHDQPPAESGAGAERDGNGAAPAAEEAGFAAVKTFEELPLSQNTLGGLASANYKTLTAIQRAAIPHALAGRDILGAAKTGSGKTLAFLIPVLEKLYRARWGRLDSLGALVLTPTRELAMQIFDELRKVGAQHDFSAGLLIGGKNVKTERDLVNGLNILVATPGRLLQHMDETPGFDAGGLQALVLDEADRILDMGFRATLDAIIENVPRERQTMLFSATQTKSVRDLARLSLSDPEYIAVHAEAGAPTPLKLQQAVMEVPLESKLDALWSFVKSHLRCKVIVFMSTCKQVRYVHEAMRRLRPGVPLRALHGKMKQQKRLTAFYEFCEAKAMVLFATDIAARGLDFPAVDWVLQADCPEDVGAYIHRVGRTARYVSGGRALMLLLPSEAAGMKAALEGAGVPLKPLRMNPKKTQKVGPALQALCSKDQDFKEMAQGAVTSYVRSVFLQPKRAVFDVSALPLAEYAASMGLLATPKLRFLKRQAGGKTERSKISAGSAPARSSQPDSSPGSSPDRETSPAAAAASQPPGRPSTATSASEKLSRAEASDDDDFMVVKARDVLGTVASAEAEAAAEAAEPSRKRKKKLRIRPGALASENRVVFDEDGRPRQPLELLGLEGEGAEEHMTPGERFQAAAAQLAARDRTDARSAVELRRRLRAAKKARNRSAAREVSGPGGGGGVQLTLDAGVSASDFSDDSSGGGYESDSSAGKAPPRKVVRVAQAAAPRQPRKPEVAHAGMVLAVAGGSLADKEALALRLLAG